MNGASLTYGLLAEFAEADQLLVAARRTSQAGYRQIDGYTPFPIEGLSEALGFRKSWMSFIVLAGGITGCISGYLLCYYCAAIAYPINVGGRPLNSWPAFIPVTFEMTILIAALSAFLGVLALNGLPQPYHPLFDVPEFARASEDRFFLCIEASDPKYHAETTRKFLEELEPVKVHEVPKYM